MADDKTQSETEANEDKFEEGKPCDKEKDDEVKNSENNTQAETVNTDENPETAIPDAKEEKIDEECHDNSENILIVVLASSNQLNKDLTQVLDGLKEGSKIKIYTKKLDEVKLIEKHPNIMGIHEIDSSKFEKFASDLAEEAKKFKMLLLCAVVDSNLEPEEYYEECDSSHMELIDILCEVKKKKFESLYKMLKLKQREEECSRKKSGKNEKKRKSKDNGKKEKPDKNQSENKNSKDKDSKDGKCSQEKKSEDVDLKEIEDNKIVVGILVDLTSKNMTKVIKKSKTFSEVGKEFEIKEKEKLKRSKSLQESASNASIVSTSIFVQYLAQHYEKKECHELQLISLKNARIKSDNCPLKIWLDEFYSGKDIGMPFGDYYTEKGWKMLPKTMWSLESCEAAFLGICGRIKNENFNKVIVRSFTVRSSEEKKE